MKDSARVSRAAAGLHVPGMALDLDGGLHSYIGVELPGPRLTSTADALERGQ